MRLRRGAKRLELKDANVFRVGGGKFALQA